MIQIINKKRIKELLNFKNHNIKIILIDNDQ